MTNSWYIILNTKIKIAANSLGRSFLKLNLLIPLIFNNKIYNFCNNVCPNFY